MNGYSLYILKQKGNLVRLRGKINATISITYDLLEGLLHETKSLFVVRTTSAHEYADLVVSELFLVFLHGLHNSLECLSHVCEVCNTTSNNQHLQKIY